MEIDAGSPHFGKLPKCAQQADPKCSTKSMINRIPVAAGSVHRAVGINVLAGMNKVGFSRIRQAPIQEKERDLLIKLIRPEKLAIPGSQAKLIHPHMQLYTIYIYIYIDPHIFIYPYISQHTRNPTIWGLNHYQYHLEVHLRYHLLELYKAYGTIILVNI